MWRIPWMVFLGLLCTACGGGIDSYETGIEAQLDIMEDVVDVLEDVTDQASAKAATPKIEALSKRLAEIATQMQELPQPTMEELQEIAEKHAKRRREFQTKATTQLMKLAEYEELSQTFTRAMSNMK